MTSGALANPLSPRADKRYVGQYRLSVISALTVALRRRRISLYWTMHAANIGAGVVAVMPVPDFP